jgi:hypothetical protein
MLPPQQQQMMTTASSSATGATTAAIMIEQQQQALLLLHPQPPPTMQVREARTSLGYDPFVGAVAGLPWTAERRAWGKNSYGAIRRTHELRYARILKGGGVIRFDLVPIDDDHDHDADDHHDQSSMTSSGSSGTTTMRRTTMMVVATVLTEVQALRELRSVRSVTFIWRRAPDKDLVPARFMDHWLYLDRQARTYAAVVFDPRHPPGDMIMRTSRYDYDDDAPSSSAAAAAAAAATLEHVDWPARGAPSSFYSLILFFS